MNRHIIVLLLCSVTLTAVKVELHDTTWFHTGVLELDDGVIYTDSDSILSPQVKVITFQTESGTTQTADTPQDVKTLQKMSADAEVVFPDAKGILLIDDGRYQLNEDGTRSYIYHYAYLIRDKTKLSQATFRHSYEDGENEVNILFARVIKPDGRTTELDASEIKIETPPRKGSLFFGRGKIITFSLPGVEIGDIVECCYENVTFNPWNKEIFEASYFFQGRDPFIFSRMVVDIPGDQTLKWKAYNMPRGREKPEVIGTNGRKTYTWVAENVAPYVPENNSPPSGDFIARVDATNQLTWDRLYDWYGGYQKERMKITPEVQALADSLTMFCDNENEITASIYHWMQKDIRYISIKGAASSGVSGHPASYTLSRGFGDCTDKSILFSTLLQAAGIQAYPVYVGTNRSVAMLDPEIPQYYGNHCITEVFLADTSFYLDATGGANGGYSRYPSFSSGDHGIYAVNAQKRKVELIPVPSPDDHLSTYNLDINVDREGNLLISARMDFHGPYEAGWRATLSRLTRREDQRVRFEKMVNSISPGAKLADFSFTDTDDFNAPLSLTLRYKLTDFLKFADSIAILRLPVVSRNLRFSEISLAERKLPLVYSTSSSVKHDINLTLPEGWKILYLPDEFALKSKEVSYSAQYIEEGGTLRFNDLYARPVREIQPHKYPDYRELLTQISKYHQKPILLLIKGGIREP